MTIEEAQQIYGGVIVQHDGFQTLKTVLVRSPVEITEELLRDVVLVKPDTLRRILRRV